MIVRKLVVMVAVAALMLVPTQVVAADTGAVVATPSAISLASPSSPDDVSGIDSCWWGSSNYYIWVKSCRLWVTASIKHLPGGPEINCAIGFFHKWDQYNYWQFENSLTGLYCENQQIGLGKAFSDRTCVTFYIKYGPYDFRENGEGACNKD